MAHNSIKVNTKILVVHQIFLPQWCDRLDVERNAASSMYSPRYKLTSLCLYFIFILMQVLKFQSLSHNCMFETED